MYAVLYTREDGDCGDGSSAGGHADEAEQEGMGDGDGGEGNIESDQYEQQGQECADRGDGGNGANSEEGEDEWIGSK